MAFFCSLCPALISFSPLAITLRVGLIPELVPQAHRHAPMRHGALGIIFRDLHKFLFRFLVPERMQQRDAALERLLHRRRAGNRKMHRAQLGLGEIFVMVMIFIFLVVGKRGELTQA